MVKLRRQSGYIVRVRYSKGDILLLKIVATGKNGYKIYTKNYVE